MWIDRTISARLVQLATQYPALLLTGARQTGKTSILKKLFPEHRYLSLDSIPLAELAEQSPKEFFQRYPAPLILDEVQYAPALFRFIKQEVDQNRHAMGQFILTGSQKFALMSGVTESLAGRIAILELEGLSFGEISAAFNDSRLPQMIVRGGFPDLWRDLSLDPAVFYQNYLQTYLERDVQQIIHIIKLRDFDRFIRLLATRHGQIVNRADLANDLNLAPSTIGEWINVLEASNVIEILEPFYFNVGKRIVKSPKLYFQDSGLVSHLLFVTEKTLLTSPFLGALWEGFVFAELRKRAYKSARQQQLFFYRDQQAREVDFVVAGDGTLDLLEVKWRELPTISDAKNIVYLRNFLADKTHLPLAVGRCGIVCSTPQTFPINQEIEAISPQDI